MAEKTDPRRPAAAAGVISAAAAALAAAAAAAAWGRGAVSMGAVPLGALAAGGWLFVLRRRGVLPRRPELIVAAVLSCAAYGAAQVSLYRAATVAPSPQAAELLARLDTLRADIESHEEWAKTVPERREAVRQLAEQEGKVGAEAGGETKVMIGGAFRSQVKALAEGLRAEFKEHQSGYNASLAAYNESAKALEGLGPKVVLRYHPPGEPLRDFRRRRGESGYGFRSFLKESAALRGFRGWGLFLEALGFVLGGVLPGVLITGLAVSLLVKCDCGAVLRVPEKGRRVTVRCPRCRKTQSVAA
ncbi:MAG: hypothetical protein HYZ75_14390 [Elusimicrobia bacterium]|nr:hypothetical protein [Elusimicrobiota bacterium]